MHRYVFAAIAVLCGLVPATSSGQVPPQQCPVVLTNTTLKTDCIGPMIVAGDNLTINLGGHSVVCPAPPGQRSFQVDGIVLQNRTNVLVTNGHVHQCSRGIYAQGGGSHSFTNLHVDINGTGILMEGSSDNHLAELDLALNDQFGIWMDNGASRNELHAGIVIRDTAVAGVFITDESNDNLVNSSKILGGNNGSVIISSSDRNVVQSSLLDGENRGCGVGVQIVRSAGTLIQGNQITRCRDGVQVLQLSTLTTLVANRVYENDVYGIIGEGSTRTHAHDNQVLRNSFGIDLRPATTNNTIEFNTVLDNAILDLEDDNPNCDANVWRSNTNVTQNQACID